MATNAVATKEFGADFAKAREMLVASADFAALREHRHQLRDGAVLTSISDLPFEMSFRCVRCAGTFWFENLAWQNGGIANWRLSEESRTRATLGCGQKGSETEVRRFGVNL